MGEWQISDYADCEKCGAKHIGYFARAFAKKELKHGRPYPGVLCGSCAGEKDGERIADEILRNPAP